MDSVHDLVFESFSTGMYGQGFAGLTIHFESASSGEAYYCVFNVNLHRARSSKHGNAGTRLPAKQFRVGKRHSFYKFWQETGLPLPSRLGSFHDYMGNLSKLQFSADLVPGKPGRICSASLRRSSNCDVCPTSRILEHSDKAHTSGIQHPDTCQTNYPDNEKEVMSSGWAFPAHSSTCIPSYEDKLISNTETGASSLQHSSHPARVGALLSKVGREMCEAAGIDKHTQDKAQKTKLGLDLAWNATGMTELTTQHRCTDPWLRSVRPKQPTSSPSASAGRYLARCSSEPYS